MNRLELTETILKEGETGGFEVVTVAGERRNPVFWRNKAGEIECVFSIQGRDLAIEKDAGHIAAVVKRFQGFADAKRRVIVLFTHNFDGTEKPDGTKAAIAWVNANIKGTAKRIEVWSEMERAS